MDGIKAKLERGLPVVGQWLSIPSPALAEIISSFGMDWLVIDTEHGPASWETVEDMMRAMKGTDVEPLIRVAGNDPVLIKRALDRGARGVVVPMINSPEQAAAAVAAAKYPPQGIRGVAAARSSRYGVRLKEYYSSWNEESLVVIQIETLDALKDVDAIAAVPGVDVLFLGPVDLSANMGVFLELDHPDFKEAVGRVLSAAENNGIAAGYMAMDPASLLEKAREGFRFLAFGTEARMIAAATKKAFSEIADGLGLT